MTHRPHATVVLALLLCAVAASADCRPGGRKLFTAGLEQLSAGDLTAAARSFFVITESQPSCAEAHNNLAVVFVEQGRFDEAAEQLRAALRSRPDYQLARRNLERLTAYAAVPVSPPASPAASPVAPASTPTARPSIVASSTAAAPVSPTPPEAIEETPRLQANSNTGADTRRANVCVIDATENRICVRDQTGGGTTAEECYPIAGAEVRAWPRWVIASEVGADRIRLLDETGQTRLQIVAEGTSASSDALRLRRADFDALTLKVVPWRSKWVVLE